MAQEERKFWAFQQNNIAWKLIEKLFFFYPDSISELICLSRQSLQLELYVEG